jgi:hypothetical protein
MLSLFNQVSILPLNRQPIGCAADNCLTLVFTLFIFSSASLSLRLVKVQDCINSSRYLHFTPPSSSPLSHLSHLSQEFDVIPAYMTKKELKLLFDLIIRSQVSEPLSLSFFSFSPHLLSVTLWPTSRQLHLLTRQRRHRIYIFLKVGGTSVDPLSLQDTLLQLSVLHTQSEGRCHALQLGIRRSIEDPQCPRPLES